MLVFPAPQWYWQCDQPDGLPPAAADKAAAVPPASSGADTVAPTSSAGESAVTAAPASAGEATLPPFISLFKVLVPHQTWLLAPELSFLPHAK